MDDELETDRRDATTRALAKRRAVGAAEGDEGAPLGEIGRDVGHGSPLSEQANLLGGKNRGQGKIAWPQRETRRRSPQNLEEEE